MRFAGLAAAILWCAGVLMGSTSERPAVSQPRTVDGFRVLSADFHVHSFPGDGALPPWTLAQEARRRGIDVIGLTNHNHMLSWPLARWTVPVSSGVLFVPGQEVTTPVFHMTAIGIAHTVAWSRSAAQVAADVHAQGGVAIVAHPDTRAAHAIGPAFVDVDGIESAHPARHAAPTSRRELEAAVTQAVTIHRGIAQIGASDFHYLAPLGVCRTYVFVREPTRRGVIDAIRAGRTVACDARGQTYGAARLASAVADDCAAAGQAPSQVDVHLNRIALVCAWCGALGLTLFGPRRE